MPVPAASENSTPVASTASATVGVVPVISTAASSSTAASAPASVFASAPASVFASVSASTPASVSASAPASASTSAPASASTPASVSVSAPASVSACETANGTNFENLTPDNITLPDFTVKFETLLDTTCIDPSVPYYIPTNSTGTQITETRFWANGSTKIFTVKNSGCHNEVHATVATIGIQYEIYLESADKKNCVRQVIFHNWAGNEISESLFLGDIDREIDIKDANAFKPTNTDDKKEVNDIIADKENQIDQITEIFQEDVTSGVNLMTAVIRAATKMMEALGYSKDAMTLFILCRIVGAMAIVYGADVSSISDAETIDTLDVPSNRPQSKIAQNWNNKLDSMVGSKNIKVMRVGKYGDAAYTTCRDALTITKKSFTPSSIDGDIRFTGVPRQLYSDFIGWVVGEAVKIEHAREVQEFLHIVPTLMFRLSEILAGEYENNTLPPTRAHLKVLLAPDAPSKREQVRRSDESSECIEVERYMCPFEDIANTALPCPTNPCNNTPSAEQTICRFDGVCTRPNCWYLHTKPNPQAKGSNQVSTFHPHATTNSTKCTGCANLTCPGNHPANQQYPDSPAKLSIAEEAKRKSRSFEIIRRRKLPPA